MVVSLCLVLFCRGAWGQQPTAPASATTAAKQTIEASVFGGIQFTDLALPPDQKPNLLYGHPFTINGNFEEVCVAGTLQRKATGATSCGKNGLKIRDVINVTSVSGKYAVAGQETPFIASQVNGESWAVTVGKLDQGIPVTFSFMFTGKLNQQQAARVADQLLASKDFKAALDQFLERPSGNADHEQAVFASAFGLVTAQAALDLLGAMHVALTNADDFRKAMSLPGPAEVGMFVHIPAQLASLRQLPANDKQMLGLKEGMKTNAAYQAIRSELTAERIADPELKTTAWRFVDTYEGFQKQLAMDVASGLVSH